jgi:hypothetical protein
LFIDFGYRKKFMLARTIASYTKKNTNSKIGVQGAMLVSINKMITLRRLMMTPTKRAEKVITKEEEYTPDQGIEGSKERKVPALVMWYLTVIDCLKHMFSNPRDVELLLWHVSSMRDGKIRHPADGR